MFSSHSIPQSDFKKLLTWICYTGRKIKSSQPSPM